MAGEKRDGFTECLHKKKSRTETKAWKYGGFRNDLLLNGTHNISCYIMM